MNKKLTFIGIGTVLLIYIVFLAFTVNKVGDYEISKPYEELTLNEKIAAKIGGYDFKTEREWEIEAEKAAEKAREDRVEQAEKEGKEQAEKAFARIEKGEFTLEQYADLSELLISRLEKNEITIQELNEINRKIADGEAKPEDFLK